MQISVQPKLVLGLDKIRLDGNSNAKITTENERTDIKPEYFCCRFELN
jgi:hypothetical protein